MANQRYNLIVIGGGAAGLVSAYIAAALKAKVLLIERNKMGGDCLNYGCVPSKALIRVARLMAEMRNAERLGIKNVRFDFDFADVMQRVHQVIKDIEPHDSVERYTKMGVECLQGDAEVTDPHTVRVGSQQFTTRSIILALGGSPTVPAIEGIEQVQHLTSDNLWNLRQLPKHLVILGAGPIGCEMAQTFRNLGSEVTLIERESQVLGHDDHDVAREVARHFSDAGINVLSNCETKRVLVEGGKQKIVFEQNRQTRAVEFDQILLATGRRPNTYGTDWRKLGIELEKNGTFKVDRYLRTTQPNIYACGDVIGPYLFTHAAAHQAWFCAVNALFTPFKKFAVSYDIIPRCTFTEPEVAQVGHNEKSARQAGIDCEVTKYDIADLDRAIAEDRAHGFVKVLTGPGKDKIIGATIVAHNAGEMITEFVNAMKHGFGLNAMLSTIHCYPTMSEANKYAAGEWKRAHAPKWALKFIENYHRWRR